MFTDAVLDQFRDSLAWLEEVMANVPDDRAAEQPAGVRNHPAWTMTHLCVALDFTATMIGLPSVCPPAWAAVAHPGSKPVTDRSVYPQLTEAMQVMRTLHESVTAVVRSADPSLFKQPSPERIRGFAPTIGHVLSYMLLAHENYHLAQLMIWKQAAGLAKD
ncbi:MAG TPA: DinB family protein [Tepidisphaeraceae bacterium]|nr:DinB family protein [Tepidisphaeraceae bacterium]